MVLSDDSSREAVSSDDGSSEEAVSSDDDEEEEEEDASEVEEPPAKKPKAVKKEKKEKQLPWDRVIVKAEKEEKKEKCDDSPDMLQAIQAAMKSDPTLAAAILSTAVSVAKEGAEPEVEASARPLKRKAAHSPPGTPQASRRSVRPRAPKVMD